MGMTYQIKIEFEDGSERLLTWENSSDEVILVAMTEYGVTDAARLLATLIADALEIGAPLLLKTRKLLTDALRSPSFNLASGLKRGRGKRIRSQEDFITEVAVARAVYDIARLKHLPLDPNQSTPGAIDEAVEDLRRKKVLNPRTSRPFTEWTIRKYWHRHRSLVEGTDCSPITEIEGNP